MNRKITTLLAIVLLSAQITPVFAQASYGPNGLCNADQMRMCGEQVRKTASAFYHKISRLITRAANYKPSDELVNTALRAEGFSPLPSAQFHRATWEERRGKQKEEFNKGRNKKAIVNTKNYEEKTQVNSSKKSTGNQPAAKKQTPAKKK